MRIVYKLVAILAMVGLVPLSAQGPVETNSEDTPHARPAPSPAIPARETANLDATDLEAWLDGFMPYALEQGQIAGAAVVVVHNGEPII